MYESLIDRIRRKIGAEIREHGSYGPNKLTNVDEAIDDMPNTRLLALISAELAEMVEERVGHLGGVK